VAITPDYCATLPSHSLAIHAPDRSLGDLHATHCTVLTLTGRWLRDGSELVAHGCPAGYCANARGLGLAECCLLADSEQYPHVLDFALVLQLDVNRAEHWILSAYLHVIVPPLSFILLRCCFLGIVPSTGGGHVLSALFLDGLVVHDLGEELVLSWALTNQSGHDVIGQLSGSTYA